MYLYKLKSPSGGVYIGQTNNFKRRMIDHKCDSSHLDTPLYRSIRKHGWENFDKIILAEIPEDQIDWEEKKMIGFATLFFNIYNLDSGGNKYKSRSIETREKLRLINTGKTLSNETKQKISIAQSGKFGSLNNNAKAVSQFSSTGVFISSYGSVIEAARHLRIDQSSIVRACKGQAKTAGGFIWRYA
ncbi:MAG: GIY-YIG nuclease family protein [Ignavibacteria bacterium]|nr:GIY-YIG nuclease family protein [Ignavibacteria bacterium]